MNVILIMVDVSKFVWTLKETIIVHAMKDTLCQMKVENA